MSEAVVDPARLTRKQLSQLLAKGGSTMVTTEFIDKQIERGAPVNSDGTLHLVQYTAWLVRRVNE